MTKKVTLAEFKAVKGGRGFGPARLFLNTLEIGEPLAIPDEVWDGYKTPSTAIHAAARLLPGRVQLLLRTINGVHYACLLPEENSA